MKRWFFLPFVLAAVAAGLVVFFDLQTPVAFGDEWVYRWIVQHAAATGHLTLWPAVNAASLVQYAITIPFAANTQDPRLLRLTVLPWMLITVFYSWRISRRLGSDRFWAAVSATLMVCSPLYLSLATGLTSDPAYLALLTAVAWYGLVWIETGRGIAPLVLTAALATLQRQYGVGLVPAMLIALVFASRRRHVKRVEWSGVAALAGAVGLALFALPLTGLATAGMSRSVGKMFHPSLGAVIGVVVAVGPMLGLLLLPAALALWPVPENERLTSSRWTLVPAALAVAALTSGIVLMVRFGTDIFPGGNFGLRALGPTFINGDKPSLWPLPLFFALEVAVSVTYLILLVRRRQLWTPASLGSGGVWLVAVAASQLMLIPATIPGDKYFLGMLAPLIPLVLAKRSSVETGVTPPTIWPGAVALVVMVAGVGLYLIGQQDHNAWEDAADAAARRAYQEVPPVKVEAGYEADGTYIGVPAFEATGQLPPGFDYFFVSPPHPTLRLLFASSTDPRPGVFYQSVAPGKIIIEKVRP